MAERASMRAGSVPGAQANPGHPLQRRHGHSSLPVSSSPDHHEQEADRMALSVMRDGSPGAPGFRRPELRASGGGEGGKVEVPPIVQEVLASPGQPLDAAARAYLEPRFGFNFCNVRVHADSRAAESARSIDALAYTMGRDVVFGKGQYAPGERRGLPLLAHELTHVVHQHGAPEPVLQRKVTVGPGLKLDTMGYTTTKAGDVYTAPAVVKKGSVFNEIFTSLFASPRNFRLAGKTDQEVSASLKEHIGARQGVITFASKKKYSFGAGPRFKMNPKYWTGPLELKPGVDSQEALDDVNKNPKEYAIACFAATEITMVGGAKSPYLINSSSDKTDWVPGDWGYIENDKFSGKPDDVGLEGENLIYVGNDQFWGHFTGKNTYRTLKEWFDEVKGWNGGATVTNQRNYPKKGLQ